MESYINLDKNMTVTTATENQALSWYDVRKEPFSLHGFYKPLTVDHLQSHEYLTAVFY